MSREPQSAVARETTTERPAVVADGETLTPRLSPDRIGEFVAFHRRTRGLKVSELARLVGVTPSLISQIERGHSRPSVATLFALADALNVSVDAFAGVPRESLRTSLRASSSPAIRVAGKSGQEVQMRAHRYVVRSNERAAIEIEGGVIWEMLTPSTSGEVDFLTLTYGPRAQSNATRYRHPGREMVLILEGSMQIDLGFETYELGPGDSIAFPSTIPHRYVNSTDSIARAVTVIIHDLDPRTALENPDDGPYQVYKG